MNVRRLGLMAFTRFAYALLACNLMACTPRVYSPPARSIPMEAPGTAGAGRTIVQGSAGASSVIFGAQSAHASVRVSHGVSEATDVVAEGTAMVITNRNGDDGVFSDVHRGVYGLRLGAKHSLSRHVALSVGLGGGGSAGGGFVSPDAGLIAGYDNPYLVPFASVRVITSVPLAPRNVQLMDNDTALNLRPEWSRGFGWVLGLRLPVGMRLEDQRRRAGLLAAVGGTQLWTDEDSDGWFGFEAGVEVRLAR